MRKKQAKALGFLNGIIASVSYGTNPLFAIPLYHGGVGVDSVLFYRYFFATIIYFIWIKFFKKQSLKINLKEGISLFFLGIIFALSSLTLFMAFKFISSGLACTILFIYPVIVAILSSFLGEKITKTTIFSIFLALFGIILLYSGDETLRLNLNGIWFVLLSALCYALYIVGVRNIPYVKGIKPYKLSFYVMAFGVFLFVFSSNFCRNLDVITEPKLWAFVFMIAIIPTIISIETITISIKIIGSTLSAVLGALEPVTALCFGVLFFGETLTIKTLIGIFLVLFGVTLVVLRDNIKSFSKEFFEKIKLHKNS